MQDVTDSTADNAKRIVERPDGFYWIDPDSRAEFGPFPTRELAIANMLSGVDSDYGPGETLAEAEAEIGITDWIDPDTGEPAENSVPHFED